MIVDVHKYLIFGAKGEMDRFFALAQRAGFLEFIGLSHKKSLELTDEIKTIMAAIKISKRYPTHPHEAPQDIQDPVSLAAKIVELHSTIEQFREEERILTAEISRIAIFGDFSKKDLHEIERDGKRVLQFFCMKSDLARETTLPPEVIFVGTEYDLDYFVAINKEKTRYPKMIEITIEEPVGVLREKLFNLQEKLAHLETTLRHYANALPALQEGLADYLNDYHLRLVKHDVSCPLGESIFLIEAWVPATRIKALFGLLSGLDVVAERIEIEPTDQIPTCMENKGVGKMGEDLVHIYDTPAPTDKDPSSWVMVFFSVFFAMIVSDAGYGLIYLLIALFLKFKFPKLAGSGKRFIKMFIIVSCCCIAWGILTASFFGISIGPDNPFRKTSFIHALAVNKAEYHMREKDEAYHEWEQEFPAVANAQDGHDFLVKAAKTNEKGEVKYQALDEFYDNILMEFSLLMGVFHLSLGMLRYVRRNWSGLGWIIFMAGGYLAFPFIIHATTMANFLGFISKPVAEAWGMQLVYGGIGLAFVLAFFQKKWGAFHEIMNVIQVFSDVLSYLRLYALALAGMIMANTFNEMGGNMGLFGGVLIIVSGHLTNISLSTMGGVIHSLRLNFLEWYHYCWDGGGKLFNPLRLRRAK
ncbi:MAG: V-type ATP synthase subunit I [Verrucomicrobia bacterium]|nr:V-type ATP synthase subunit I [Verrucomicrobiota bacterium]